MRIKFIQKCFLSPQTTALIMAAYWSFSGENRIMREVTAQTTSTPSSSPTVKTTTNSPTTSPVTTTTTSTTITTATTGATAAFSAVLNLTAGDNTLNTQAIAVCDVNNDGFDDIIVGNYDGPNQFLLSSGDGSNFVLSDIPGGIQNTASLAVADVNKDGYCDVIFGNYNQANQLSYGSSSGFISPIDLPGSNDRVGKVAVGNVNGDGYPDIVIGGDDLELRQLLMNDGSGNFTTHLDLPCNGFTSAITCVDVNQDGNLDIVFGTFGFNEIIQNNGGGNFSSIVDLPGGSRATQALLVADADGDGMPNDIVVANYMREVNQLLLNDGSGQFSVIELPGGNFDTLSIAVADMNRDGFDDIIFGNAEDPNQLLLNDRNGGFVPTDLPGGSHHTRSIAVGDVNGDGYPDVVIGNVNGPVQLLLNAGSGGMVPDNVLADLEGKSITQDCTIGTSLGQSEINLTCTAEIDAVVTGGTIKTSLTEGACSAGSTTLTDGSEVTITLDGDLTCKNSGTCNWTHCFRADFWYNGMSVLANMTEVASTVTYDSEGGFTATVETGAFTATDATSSAVRFADVSARLGPCDTPTRQRTLRKLQVEIGSTLEICVYSDDVDVTLTLRDVTANPGSQTLVNSDGIPNFVTAVSNAGTSTVTLSTLMIPVYYDAQGGAAGNITIEGTAGITYNRRHRLLSSKEIMDNMMEQAPFKLEIAVIENKISPAVTHQPTAEESAGDVIQSERNMFGTILVVAVFGFSFLI